MYIKNNSIIVALFLCVIFTSIAYAQVHIKTAARTNDGFRNPAVTAKNTITFHADVSSIIGSGYGWFDPVTDTLFLSGVNYNTNVQILSGNGKMIQDTSNPQLFSTTFILQGKVGDSCSYRFTIIPPDKFYNSGIEMSDRWYVFRSNNSVIDVAAIKPQIQPKKLPLSKPLTTLFECNMNNNPVNFKNNRPIPVDSVDFVGLKGSNATLGLWNGYWTASDTLASFMSMIVLNDKGLFGDRVAGDKIFSRNVTFPTGTASGTVEFKFGASYPAVLTDASGFTPLDNESAFGVMHSFFLEEDSPLAVSLYFHGNSFVTMLSEQKTTLQNCNLSQNYPNPFNPTTKIHFSVSKSGLATLKIFDLLGNELYTLVNSELTAGHYSVDFNAANLPSGLYLYKLTAGSSSITKKMLLLK